MPTHDGLTLVVVGWPYREFDTNKRDVEAAYLGSFELAPDFAERIRHAKREAPFRGGAVPNFFRRPFGPGWAPRKASLTLARRACIVWWKADLT